MSERVRESIVASLLASKRFVVALCAAIAMVLGAMSAGASVFTGSTGAAEPPPVANVVFTEVSRDSTNRPSPEIPLFTRHSTLNSGQIVTETPRYTNDDSSAKKGLNLKLNQDVVKTANAPLFYNPTPEIQDPASSSTTSEPAVPITGESDNTDAATTEPPDHGNDPATSDPAPSTDPTTEPGLNSRVAPESEESPKP